MSTTIYFRGQPSIAIEGRDDLLTEVVQVRIRACLKASGAIRCGCCDNRPVLHTYDTSHGLTLRSERRTEHAVGCVITLDRPSLADTLPSEGIFLDHDRHDSPHAIQYVDGRPVVSYRNYVGRVISAGLVDGWVRHLCTCPHIPNAPATAIVTAIDAQLRRLPFDTGESGPVVAQRHGLRLVHGVVERLGLTPKEWALPGIVPLYSLAAVSVGKDVHLASSVFGVPIWRVKRAMDEAKHWGQYTRGPYYFLAAVDASGFLRRLALMPVYFDGKALVFVDSAKERFFTHELLCRGKRFYKPTDHRELTALGRATPALGWLVINWCGYTPDFVGLAVDDRFLLELNGGIADTEYQQRLKDKLVYYPEVLPTVHSAEVHGERFKWTATFPIEESADAIRIDRTIPPFPEVLEQQFGGQQETNDSIRS